MLVRVLAEWSWMRVGGVVGRIGYGREGYSREALGWDMFGHRH